MSKKKLFGISLAVFAAVCVGVAIYVANNINETPAVVVDQTPRAVVDEAPASDEPRTVFTGEFQGVDAVHWAKGTVEIIESGSNSTLSFSEDFEVAQGPDLFVYLSPNAAGEELGEVASLGELQATSGAQTYVLPANYKDYKTVVIWCRAFGVTFATVETTY